MKPQIDEKGINEVVDAHNHDPAELLAILSGLQERYGHLEIEMLRHVADLLDIPLTSIYAVATFYKVFRFEPPGEITVQCCTGTSCHVVDGAGVLDALKRSMRLTGDRRTSRDGKFSLEEVHCLGLCCMAPVIRVGEEYRGNLTRSSASKAIRDLKKG